MKHNTIEQWHKLVNDQDPSGLSDILDDDAVFHSPVVHTPQVGKDITQMYLTAAFHVLFTDSFQYVRDIVSDNEAMLEFVVELDGIVVNGVDIISWNDRGKIVEFKVMIRPLKGINKVQELMMKKFQNS